MLEKKFVHFITQIDGHVYGNCLPVLVANIEFEGMEKIGPYCHYYPSQNVIGVTTNIIQHAIGSSPIPLPHGCYIIWLRRLEPYVTMTIGRRMHITPELILLSMATKAVWMRILGERKKAWDKNRDVMELFLTADDFIANLPADFPIPTEAIEPMYEQEISGWYEQADPDLLSQSQEPEQVIMSHAESYFASTLAMHCGTIERIAEFFKGCRQAGFNRMKG
jgi:hypothetical protein